MAIERNMGATTPATAAPAPAQNTSGKTNLAVVLLQEWTDKDGKKTMSAALDTRGTDLSKTGYSSMNRTDLEIGKSYMDPRETTVDGKRPKENSLQTKFPVDDKGKSELTGKSAISKALDGAEKNGLACNTTISYGNGKGKEPDTYGIRAVYALVEVKEGVDPNGQKNQTISKVLAMEKTTEAMVDKQLLETAAMKKGATEASKAAAFNAGKTDTWGKADAKPIDDDRRKQYASAIDARKCAEAVAITTGKVIDTKTAEGKEAAVAAVRTLPAEVQSAVKGNIAAANAENKAYTDGRNAGIEQKGKPPKGDVQAYSEKMANQAGRAAAADYLTKNGVDAQRDVRSVADYTKAMVPVTKTKMPQLSQADIDPFPSAV